MQQRSKLQTYSEGPPMMKKQQSQSQIDFTVDDEDIYSARAKRPDTTTAVEHEESLFKDRSDLNVMADDSAS